jgi:hypothetical protein
MISLSSPNYAAVTALVLIGVLAASADDWPQWRGPNRDGAWKETGIMEAFPPDGLPISWRTPVGRGWSSPVIADGRVYITDVLINDKSATERVLAFDGHTGNRLWTHAYPVEYRIGRSVLMAEARGLRQSYTMADCIRWVRLAISFAWMRPPVTWFGQGA